MKKGENLDTIWEVPDELWCSSSAIMGHLKTWKNPRDSM
jgi:hypothetical protein